MGVLIILVLVILILVVTNVNKGDRNKNNRHAQKYENTNSKPVFTHQVNIPTYTREANRLILTSSFKSYSLSEHKQFILDAVREKKRIEINYTAYSGENTVRIISPLEIVWFNQSECIKAFCYKRNEERSFKILRINKMRSA